MTQISFIREESRNKGAKRTIKLPAIAAGATKQYTKNDSKLKGVIGEYGVFNQITILNNGDVDIEVSLDFTAAKTYPIPAASSISLDEVSYQGFNVVNLDAGNATVVDKITIIAAYERSLMREPIKSKKQMYGGVL